MKRAFSLIELSIVILIIGILVAGITQSSRLVSAMRLNSARALTQSSPVNSIKDLTLWLETTSTKSFATGTSTFTNVEELDNDTSIGRWNDINPQASSKNNATKSTSDQAKYTTNAINGLPAVRFNGTNNNFAFDGTVLVNTNYTIFVVEQRRSNGSNGWLLIGSASASNTNLHVGYQDDTTMRYTHFNNNLTDTVSAYSSPAPRLHIFRFDQGSGRQYWRSDDTTNPGASDAQTALLAS